MSESVCKNCYKTLNTSRGHICLNDQWIPVVVEINRTAQAVAENTDCFRPRSTPGPYNEGDRITLDGYGEANIKLELFKDHFLSNEAMLVKNHGSCSGQDSTLEGSSFFYHLTIDSEQCHKREWAISDANDHVFNIDDMYTNELYMAMRHGIPNSEVPLNILTLNDIVKNFGFEEESLNISSVSNSCNDTPVFPTNSGTVDGIKTNKIASLHEFEDDETCNTMQNALILMNKAVEGNPDYHNSENPAMIRKLIIRPSSLIASGTETTMGNNQYAEIDHRISLYDQNPQNIPMRCDLESITKNFTSKEFETGPPPMLSSIPTHESSFSNGSINDHVRLHANNDAILGRNCPYLPTGCEIGLNDRNFATHPEEATIMNYLTKETLPCMEEGPSDDAHSLPGPISSQLNEFDRSEVLDRSPSTANVEPHSVVHPRTERFICCFCEREFTRKWNLKMHMYIHKGKKPFECEVCKAKFGRKGHLKRHAIIHTSDRPFECEICGKKFFQMWNLKRHIKTHKFYQTMVEKNFQTKELT